MTQKDQDELLNVFLNKFNAESMKQLRLEQYTNNGQDRDDFTYWIEWKLDCFGGIRGGSSYKFGIFKTNETPSITKQGYSYDEENHYAWANKYGLTSDNAFGKILNDIITVIQSVQKEIAYEAIERVDLGDAFKWKIAFLYSNYRLVPVYKKEVLYTASKRLGILDGNGSSSSVAQLQKKLVEFYNKNSQTYNNDICFFGREIWRIGNLDLFQSKQIVKYGAPGTGKTYTAKMDAEDFFEIWKLDAGNPSLNFTDHYDFVQFHHFQQSRDRNSYQQAKVYSCY